MMCFKTLLFVATLLQIMVSTPVSTSDVWGSCSSLVRNMNDFGFELSKKLDQTGNLFISPFSIYTAIMMTYRGAKHRTATEIENALQLGRDGLIGSDTQHSFATCLENLLTNSMGNHGLETANGLFLHNEFPVKEDYVNELKSFERAIVKQLDFAKAGQAAKKEVNDWVAKVTHGKIGEMLSEIPSASTKFIIMNAIYFKGFWKTPFDKNNTYDGTFNMIGGGKKQVKMMKMAEVFPRLFFYEDKKTGYKYLQLPYKGDDIAMLLALPRSAQDFSDMPMNSSKFSDEFAKLKKRMMDTVAIPKFSLQYKTELKKALIALGIRDLFAAESSDLGGISDVCKLSVSSVVLKAVLEVNEEGTEAAAATKVIGAGATPVKKEFVADHPFLLYIVDKRNGLVLFSGRVTDP